MNQKRPFLITLAVLAIFLMVMPFVATFNDFLTRGVINLRGYRFIREFIVPFEVKAVALFLRLFGFSTGVTNQYVVINNQTTPFLVEIVWNCIGWQSLLFFAISALIGLSGQFTRLSKIKALIFGLGGTFLVNIIRIALVTVFAYYFGHFPALVFHDYGSLFLLVGWLFFCWWFVYRFVLEERK